MRLINLLNMMSWLFSSPGNAVHADNGFCLWSYYPICHWLWASNLSRALHYYSIIKRECSYHCWGHLMISTLILLWIFLRPFLSLEPQIWNDLMTKFILCCRISKIVTSKIFATWRVVVLKWRWKFCSSSK